MAEAGEICGAQSTWKAAEKETSVLGKVVVTVDRVSLGHPVSF
jgi:hypothetical protein